MKKFFFVFKLYFLIYLLLAFNAFVNETIWMHYATILLVVSGMVVLCCMLVHQKEYREVWNIWLIVAFLISYVLSSILTFHYGIMDNVKEIIWLSLSMIVLYASNYICAKEERKREFQILVSVYVVGCTLFNAVGNSMVLWGRPYGIAVKAGGQDIGYKEIGYKWGRLWGVYDDPNHGATITVAAILLTLYLLRIAEKRFVKILLIFTLVINFCYIILSDSRTGLVSLGIGVFIWATVQLFFQWEQKGYSAKKAVAASALIGLVLAAGMVGAMYGCKKQYNVLDKKIEMVLAKRFPNRNTGNKNIVGQIRRKNVLKQDASNGRLDIWMSGLEIVGASPIYGVSFRNIATYAEENMPETYLVNNPEQTEYTSLHNSVLDVLVSQGLIGIIILILIFGNTFRLLKKKILMIRGEMSDLLIVCFAVAVAMGSGSMFLSMLFYLNAPQNYIFWLCLGFLVTTLKGGETLS